MVFNRATWVDVADEAAPPAGAPATSATQFNRIEQGIVDAHAHLAESLSAHGGVLIYVGASTNPPTAPPTGLLWHQTDGVKRDLRNIGTSAAPAWEDVTRDKLVASDLVTDYVVSGLLPAVPSPQSLTASVPAGAAYVIGRRVAKAAQSLIFAKAQDTYVDLNRDGTYVLAPVANGAAAPAIAANAIRLFRAVTDADRAQVDTVTVATVTNSAVYTVRTNGVDVSYTSDATATAGEIAIGLRDAINASVDPNVTPVTAATAALATDTTASLTITADVAGVPFTATVSANLTVANTTANNTAKITAVADLRTLNPTVRGAGGGDHNLFSARHPDVDAADVPANGEVLTYDGVAGKWKASPAPAGATPEAWREVGATNQPAFQNAWVNHTPTVWETAAFYKDPQGRVHIKGLVKSGTVADGSTGTIFTLPTGYRPAKGLLFPAETFSTTNVHGRITVTAAGGVQAAAGGNAYFSLNGVSFRAA